MASKPDVELKIGADTEVADRNLNKLAKNAEHIAKDIGEHFFELGHLIGGALAGFTLKEVIVESIEADRAISQLRATLKLTNEDTHKNIEAFENLAESMLNLKGVDDEVVLGQVSFLKSLGATNAQVQKIIPVAGELSTALSQDLGTSTRNLALLFQGVLPRELARSFTGLRKFSEEQLRAGAGVDYLAGRLKGLSESMRSSVSVQIDVLGQRFKNLLQGIGDIVVKSPLFLQALLLVNDTLKTMKTSLEGVSFKDVAEGLLRLGVAVGFIYTLPKAIFAASAAMDFFRINLALAEARGLTAGQAIATGFKAATASIEVAGVAMKAFKALATLGLTLLIDQLITTALRVDSVGGFFEALGIKIQKALVFVVDLAFSGLAKLFDVLSKIPKVGDTFKGISEAFKGGSEGAGVWQKELSAKLAIVEGGANKTAAATHEATGAVKKFGETATGLGKDSVEAFEEFKTKLKELKKELRFSGTSGQEKLLAEQAEKQKLLLKGLKEGQLKNEKEYQELRFALDKEYTAKIAEQRKQQLSAAGITGAGSQAIFTKLGGFQRNANPERLNETQAIGADLLGGIAKGAEGAKNLLIQGSTAAAAALTGVPPQLIAPVMELLGKSQEEVKKTIEGFADAIPAFIQGIVENIPVIIEAFNEKLPEIFSKITQMLPAIAIRFATDLSSQMPFIATRMAIEFVKRIPEMVRGLATGIVDAIKQAIGQIGNIGGMLGIGGGGGGGIFGGGGFLGLGFATGGLVPKGYPNDKFPARLTSGELVIDNSLTAKLDSYLSGKTAPAAATKEERVTRTESATYVLNFNMDDKVIAQKILSLNNQGYRLA